MRSSKLFIAVVYWCLAIVVALQAVATIYFIWRLTRTHPIPDENSPEKKVAVVLCVRGHDPFLKYCIAALLNLDYSNYRVHIVVDSEADPAMKTVRAATASDEYNRAHVHVLSEKHETCGLKCSGLTQVIESLGRDVEVVALVDADVVVHPTWLHELVAPLSQEDVAVTTGNRWYQPASANLGSIVRYVWNAAAVVQMVCFDVPWGGTLAIKRSFIERADLLSHWRHGFCEDTMLHRHLNLHGMKMVFVPSLLMINRESCSLRPFIPWVARQLITLRLHHPCWSGTVAHGVWSTLIPGVALAAMLVAALSGQWESFLGLASALVLFQIGLLLLLIAAQWIISSKLAKTHKESTWPPIKVLACLPAAIIATQLSYSISLAQSVFATTVHWRGIRYQVTGNTIRMENYQPYAASEDESSMDSL